VLSVVQVKEDGVTLMLSTTHDKLAHRKEGGEEGREFSRKLRIVREGTRRRRE
jgi:hypothetical protein